MCHTCALADAPPRSPKAAGLDVIPILRLISAVQFQKLKLPERIIYVICFSIAVIIKAVFNAIQVVSLKAFMFMCITSKCREDVVCVACSLHKSVSTISRCSTIRYACPCSAPSVSQASDI